MGKYLDMADDYLAQKTASDPSRYEAPLDAEGVPCGGCPTCGKGEFWPWPKFHRQRKPTGWFCWFCAPPPAESGPCDFCGVPDEMLRRTLAT
jgi:hypothetical protein